VPVQAHGAEPARLGDAPDGQRVDPFPVDDVDGGGDHVVSRDPASSAARGPLDSRHAYIVAYLVHRTDQLAGLLAGRGDLDELRARADAGDLHAADQLAGLLAGRGDLDGAVQIMRACADAGHGEARRLAGLLIRQGRGEEAERLRRFGLAADGSIACG
jgi:hypothetical protein